MFILKIFSTFVLFIIVSCSKPQTFNPVVDNTKSWLIPSNQIYDGGPGKDGIPALTNPELEIISNSNSYHSTARVLLYKKGQEVRVYPHPILNWHEIINDNISSENITISYCPLTGTGIGFRGEVQLENEYVQTTFGVSGLLYNSNLILYDRETDSYWSQMAVQCVGGILKSQRPGFIPLVETKFETASALYPQAKIVSTNTGVYSSDRYSIYPYGDYSSNNNSLIFPVSVDDNRLPRKERVLGIIDQPDSRVYRFKSFGDSLNVINDQLNNIPLVIAGSKKLDIIVSFKRPEANVTMRKTSAAFPALMEDTRGNIYNIFGEAIAGPNTGFKLEYTKSFMGFWFSFGAFYPGIGIYGE